ncbi:MAG: glycosyltransferase 87 family protein [Planctomycetota bacterium]|jgi:hypothetical protein
MVIVVVWAVISLAALVVALAAMQIDRSPTVESGAANIGALWPFWIASASGWVSLTALWMLLRRAPRQRLRPTVRGAALILTVAIAARGVVLVVHEPALSDDVYRYVFDGRNATAGINPYLVTPADAPGPADDRPGLDELRPLINNPELHTIYLPTSEWVFAATATVIASDRAGPASSARLFRGVFVLFELVAIVLLLVALGESGRSPWWAALYAWHPLPIAEIAGSGHQDAIGLALLVAALVLGATAARRGWWWVGRWTGLVALAALVKPMVLPLAALLLKGRPWGTWVRSLAVGAVVCAAVAAPLWLTHDARPLENLLATVERFTLKWAHFGSVYEPVVGTIRWLAPRWGNDAQEVLARRLCAAMVVVVLAGVWARPGRGDVWARSRAVFLAMVLLSPAAHPWYLLWALVLVPMAPSPGIWIASLTLPWGYVVLGDVVDWSVPGWVMIAAYVPIYAAVLAGLARFRGRPTVLSPPPSARAQDRESDGRAGDGRECENAALSETGGN